MFSSKKIHFSRVALAILCFIGLTVSFWSGDDHIYAAESNDSVNRINGGNRFETSALISESGFESAEKVIITNAREFADALAGVPLAHQYNAPILLAQGNGLREATVNEINRLGAKEAIILGGEIAISKEVEESLQALGLSTRRLAGDNRFETAEIIADELLELTSSDTAVVVDGFEFADAMSIAPFAAREGLPIYLSRSNRLTSKDALNKYDETIIIGGEKAITTDVESQLNNPTRISGDNRYETNINVMKHFGLDATELYVATGLDFPDALTGSLLAAKNNSAVALVRRGLSPQLKTFMTDYSVKNFVLFGGELVINKTVEAEVLDVATNAENTFTPDLKFDIYPYRGEMSVVIEVSGYGVDKLIDPDGKTNEVESNEQGKMNFIYPIDKGGQYTFTAVSESGEKEELFINISDELYKAHTIFFLTGDHGWDYERKLPTIMFFGNIYNVIEPEGVTSIRTESTPDNRYIYTVSETGSYTFIVEHPLGFIEEFTFEISDYHFIE